MAHMTNPLATPEQLYRWNSFSSLPSDIQEVVFYQAQCLTQAAGILLQLPQSVTAQANVLLARYWLVDPIMSHEFSDVSAACIYLTAKMGPSPRSPRDVSNVYAYLLSPASAFLLRRDETSPAPPDDPSAYHLSEADYAAFHTRILSLEARVLYALSFDTHAALPHPLAVTYLQALDFLGAPGGPRSAVPRRALAYLNTALLSPQLLYATHQPCALAVAAIYAAARDVPGARAPEFEWWEVFDVDREELGFLVVAMRSVEGWMRKREEEMPGLFARGMVTRAAVEDAMRERGLSVGNGSRGPAEEKADAEEEMMRKMDERVAQIEAQQ
ncbi:Cyclin domain-containing protein [Pleurostoma richardsiae]|uniref:Cyclin domain-containing protein n=1 Tax=Pleurostoma richardsiae TaxID=41990 RepID=A0AA38R3Y8_9PEZI|nr:Cyclin domain-containing protein [Pleurostoma richardsiae]